MPKPTDIPSAQEFGEFRSSLAQMKDADNKPLWKQAQINEAVGTQVNGRTWKDLEIDLISFLKVAEKSIGDNNG